MGSIFSEWKYSGLKKSGWNIKGSIIWKRVKTPWRTMNRTSKNSVQSFSTFVVSITVQAQKCASSHPTQFFSPRALQNWCNVSRRFFMRIRTEIVILIPSSSLLLGSHTHPTLAICLLIAVVQTIMLKNGK